MILAQKQEEKRKQKRTTCPITQFFEKNVHICLPHIPLYLYGLACDMCAKECQILTRTRDIVIVYFDYYVIHLNNGVKKIKTI